MTEAREGPDPLSTARDAAADDSARWRQRFASSQAALVDLQAALLPAEVPVLPGLQIGARYLLCDADTGAGGDWFDAVPLADGRVALVVGDVVGHGIVGSAVMGQLRPLLAQRLADGEPLKDGLAALDRASRRIDGTAGTTVCAAVVDRDSGQVEYCTAGHPAPLIIRGPEWEYLDESGAGPLASGAGFATANAELRDGDVLVLYSDGLVERPGRPVDRSTVEIGVAVTNALAQRAVPYGASTHAPDRICELALELLTRITGHSDDITVLAARRIGPPAPLYLSVHAEPAAIWSLAVELERWLAAVDAGPADQSALRHAIVELLSNTVGHAYRRRPAGTVTLRGELNPDGYVTITVSDDGTWRRPGDAGDPRIRRLGLALVREVVDEFGVDHSGDGTVATIRRRLRRPVPLPAEAPRDSGRHPARARDDELIIEAEGDRLTVRGPLLLGTAGALAVHLGRETRGGTRSLIVDLSGVTHLASSGVTLLQEARAAAERHGEHLSLLASPGSVADHVLSLVSIDHGCGTDESSDDALWS